MFIDQGSIRVQYEADLVGRFVELYSKQNIRLGEDWYRAIIHKEILVRPYGT